MLLNFCAKYQVSITIPTDFMNVDIPHPKKKQDQKTYVPQS